MQYTRPSTVRWSIIPFVIDFNSMHVYWLIHTCKFCLKRLIQYMDACRQATLLAKCSNFFFWDMRTYTHWMHLTLMKGLLCILPCYLSCIQMKCLTGQLKEGDALKDYPSTAGIVLLHPALHEDIRCNWSRRSGVKYSAIEYPVEISKLCDRSKDSCHNYLWCLAQKT